MKRLLALEVVSVGARGAVAQDALPAGDIAVFSELDGIAEQLALLREHCGASPG